MSGTVVAQVVCDEFKDLNLSFVIEIDVLSHWYDCVAVL